MARRSSAFTASAAITRAYRRGLKALTKATLSTGRKVARQATKASRQVARQQKAPRGAGDWLTGMAMGPAGARRYHLFRPPGIPIGERRPLMVMLHGCGQSGHDFARSTRMNMLAAREGFFVLYPEQDRLANAHGCWNWFDRRSGKADAEATTLMAAVDQACLLYPVDRGRVAIAGLSAGASMAALVATRYPARFKAVAMHSGVAPGAAKSPATALGAMRGRHAPPMPVTAVGKAMGAAAALTLLPPLLVIHGDADTIVAAKNAGSSAEVWAAATAAVPGLQRTVQRGKRHSMRLTEYKRARRTFVLLCEIAGLGHAWSGGLASLAYSDPAGPDATRLIWRFAMKQFEASVVG
ncbi:Esterase, PHB depolymerase family [Burkholderiales bacterium 8X]|nr:Esterase, PHB depolymerase family [Burkholderiales bacterium 8X]